MLGHPDLDDSDESAFGPIPPPGAILRVSSEFCPIDGDRMGEWADDKGVAGYTCETCGYANDLRNPARAAEVRLR